MTLCGRNSANSVGGKTGINHLFVSLMLMFFLFRLFSYLHPIMPPTEFAEFLPQSVVIYNREKRMVV